VALAAGPAVAVAVAVAAGPVRIPAERVLRAIAGAADDPVDRAIVAETRLPRALLAGLAGAGLAAAGAAYQGLFRNPLADPFVVGSASGAAVGATLVLVTGWSASVLGVSAVPLGAFAGALAAAALVVTVAGLARGVPLVGLLLAGAAVAALLNAAVWVILSLYDQPLERVVNWLFGSFSQRGWPELDAAWPWLAAGGLGLWLTARPLDALAAGEETARNLGLNVRLASAAVLAFGSLATAAAVAAGGVIGFVGFVSPYLARRVVGNRHVALLPASALVGAAVLILSDTAARVVLAPTELRVGVVTALLAGPFFLLVLRGGR
jgi:iron complex transport system permease protein